MRASWTMAACAALLAGCSTMDRFTAEPTLDPTKVYLDTFDTIETTRREIDRYRCLSGAPLACEVIAITVECSCQY